MPGKVLITGASGLLGKALVKECSASGYQVLGQYHTHKPAIDNCLWLQADFSSLNGIRDFLKGNRAELSGCSLLVNNYGPITNKPVVRLSGEDFIHDYFHNVVTAFEITRFLIETGELKRVVSITFQFAGEMRVYKKILTYAAAKNAVELMTRSFKAAYPEIGFETVLLPTLEGAQVRFKKGAAMPPQKAAKDILRLLEKRKAGT